MESKGLFINDLPQSGEVTFLAVVIEKKHKRPKRNGEFFLALRFADRSGELDGKVWENPEIVSQSFERDDVVKVRGTVEVYNDKPQLIVSRIRRCESTEYNAADFYVSSTRDPDEMFGELQGFVTMVRGEPLRQLLDLIVNDPAIGERLKSAPAAMKIHHAFRGWPARTHPLAVQSFSGAVRELSAAESRSPDRGRDSSRLGQGRDARIDRRSLCVLDTGQLIEHVTLGLEILERYTSRIPEFPLELKTILQHLLVRHHGDLDKGALRRPMFPEAFALSLLDLLDARLEQAYRLIDSAPSGDEFTAYVPSLERQLFRGFGAAAAKANGGRQAAEGGKAA